VIGGLPVNVMDERDPPRLPLANVHVPFAEVTDEMVLVCDRC
jgi:hypothetical protein